MHSRDELKPYQLRAIEFIKQNPNCALWVDMGLGKTVSTLTAFADMRASFDVQKMLVIAPLRVARDVWDAEVAAWAQIQGLRVSKILGNPAQRKYGLDMTADIHTINREQTVWLTEQFVQGKKLVRRWPWDMVTIDESSGFRSQSAQRWKALRRIRKLFPRMTQLTGTPRPKSLRNLWAQFYLLDQGQRLGTTETGFLQKWFDPPRFYEFGKWTPKPNAKREIEAAVADLVLCLREEDYLTLPPVMHNIIKVKLSDQAYAKYKKLERVSLMETMMGNKIAAVNAGVLAGKLLQLANGAIYVDEGKYELLHDAKIDALLELLDDADGPTLIAYNFRSDLERVGKALDKFCRASGKTWDVLKTEESVRRWNAGGTDYLLLHPASAGHGLNLQHSGSKTLILFGLTYDTELHAQLFARLFGGHRRAGMIDGIAHYLVAEGTIDEDVIQIVAGDQHDQDALMRALSSRLGESAEAMRPQPTKSADWQF